MIKVYPPAPIFEPEWTAAREILEQSKQKEVHNKMQREQSLLMLELVRKANIECRLYSGRGMYGEQCLGIDIERGREGSYLADLIDATAEFTYTDEYLFALSAALKSMKIDSMGRGQILYFEHCILTKEDIKDKVEDENEDD